MPRGLPLLDDIRVSGNGRKCRGTYKSVVYTLLYTATRKPGAEVTFGVTPKVDQNRPNVTYSGGQNDRFSSTNTRVWTILVQN